MGCGQAGAATKEACSDDKMAAVEKLFADEHFVNLLRAEGLDTLPKYLAERIDNLNGAAA